jgi:hypothetical protein
VSPNLGVGGTASPTAFTSVFSYIGSPPQVRRNSKLTWRQGPCHLMEDIVSTNVIRNIYNLGPTYIGSFQSPNMGKSVCLNHMAFIILFFTCLLISYFQILKHHYN